MAEPQQYSLKELEDGTYSLMDVLLINQILDLKQHMKKQSKVDSNE